MREIGVLLLVFVVDSVAAVVVQGKINYLFDFDGLLVYAKKVFYDMHDFLKQLPADSFII